MISTPSLERLIAKYGAEALAQGVAAQTWARNNARTAGLIREDGPELIAKALPQLQPERVPPAEDPQPLTQIEPAAVVTVCEDKPIEKPQELRIYPLILLAAIRTKQDIAARCWFIAKSLDPGGNGWVYKQALTDFLRKNNIGERQRRRWIAAALAAGLLFEDHEIAYGTRPVYRLLNFRTGAEILGAADKSYPALIPTRLLLRRSWHPYAWAGYLATKGPNPISQAQLAELTGLSVRVIKKYTKLTPINDNKTVNYCQTDLDETHLTGMRENGRPSAFVGYKRKVYFRLPNSYRVPESLARRPSKSASVKVKHSRGNSGTFSDILGGEKCELIRLFHKDEKSADKAKRKLAKDDRLPWNKPQELFIFKKGRKTHNVWAMVSVAE